MTKLTLTVTRGGLERFTAAQLDDDLDLSIATVGLTDRAFVAAPTLDALPGEFKRLATISGDQVGDNIIHMTLRDESEDAYTAKGFGLFLADGTLFATYCQESRLFEKSPRATFLAAIDIGFPTGDVSELRFGNTDFLNPPATTTRKGVVRLATPAEVAAGQSSESVTTPADLRRVRFAGEITIWYGSAEAVPAGWAICDGRQVERSDGTGPITTPDLRGRVVVGASADQAPGALFGAASHALSTSAAGNHNHAAATTITPNATGLSVDTSSRSVDAGSSANNVLNAVSLIDPGHAHGAATTTEAAGTHHHDLTIDVIQPSIALHFIMKV
ncbi:tail fiber protein [Sphingomonas sp.]|jgi:microcystin-dependent protein|uniref:tail fiber protein n=1 Tax=Sphingomonas sp. TaxID=28214 RepID=UPI00260826A5|nr:tail fiber protein [Sphingomonas sp.]MDF2602972.1 hypothetical protein [Sphingomonas sp.]